MKLKQGLGFSTYRVQYSPEALTQLARIDTNGWTAEDATFLDTYLLELKALGWLEHVVLATNPAATLEADGNGAVATLPDLSGNDNDLTQSTTGFKPTAVTWGGTIVDFDSNLNAKDGTSPLGTPVTTLRPDGKYDGAVAVDEATTNELSDPDDFTQWSQVNGGNGSVSADDTTAPDGTTTADRIEQTGTGSYFGVTSDVSISAGDTVSEKIYLKRGDVSECRISLLFRGGTSLDYDFDIDFSAESVTPVDATTSDNVRRFEAVTSDWYVLEVTATDSNNDNDTARFAVWPTEGSAIAGYTYAWHPQSEIKGYSTSFVNGSRAAGSLKYSKDLLSAEEGTIAVDVYVRDGAPHDDNSVRQIFNGRDAAQPSNALILRHDGTGNLELICSDGGGNISRIETPQLSTGWHRVVVTWDKSTTTARLYVDGSEADSSTSSNIPNSVNDWNNDAFHVGTSHTGSSHWNSRLDNLVIEKRAWTSTEVSEDYNADSPASEATRQVLAIDGTDDYVSIADNASLSVGDEDAFWLALVRFDVLASTDSIISKWDIDAGDYREWWLRIDTNGQVDIVVSSDGALSGLTTLDLTTVNASEWVLVYGAHDATNNELVGSVNAGTLTTVAHSGGVLDGPASVNLGARNEGSTQFLNGQLGPILMGKGYIPTAAEITEYKEFLENSFGLDLS